MVLGNSGWDAVSLKAGSLAEASCREGAWMFWKVALWWAVAGECVSDLFGYCLFWLPGARPWFGLRKASASASGSWICYCRVDGVSVA